MNNEILSAILLGVIPATSGWVILYWHLATKGTWRDWPAGRSLMGLLGIITVGFGYGVLNRFLGQYPARYVIAVVLYAGFVGALIFIGYTIRRELNRGRSKEHHPSNHPTTGTIDITVATDKEPSHD